jgi:phosphotriesterase-related protein
MPARCKSLTRRAALLSFTPLLSAALPKKSILVHEHILVDFGGAAIASPSRYNRAEVIAAARPHLDAIAKLGCVRLLECTPNFLGRDPLLLAELARLTGLEIWTNTGLYAARQYQHLPPYVRTETAAQLARRWASEYRQGVDGVKPRFIKIGVNDAPLGEIDRKLVEAAAIASLETGLTIASHTGRGAGPEQIEMLEKLRFPLQKFVWVHAQNEKDHAIHAAAARAGAWVEFDGISPASTPWHLACVRAMQSQNLLHRVLISHDSGWWHVGEPAGGNFRGYTSLYEDFAPQLPGPVLQQLLWDNPRTAFGK